MLELKRSAFHARTSSLCLAQNWRRWAGHIVAGSYDLVLDREYWAIRNAAALIDISPLMKYRISGKDAARLLHRVTPRNIHKMAVGQVAYTGWCDEHGKLIDDGTIARLAEDTFRLTAAEPSLRWLAMNAVGMGVEINDESDRLAALSLQGPKSRAVLNGCAEEPLDTLKYFRLMHNRIDGVPVTISRTGYTGDLGYEIWMETGAALAIWDRLIAAGHGYGITPCGILAMDMARVEAGLFMIDVDYTSAHAAWIDSQKSSPYELGLDWTVHLDKPGYFVGRQALEREQREGAAWKMVGVEVDWEGMERLFAAVGLPPQIPGMAVRGSLPIYAGKKQVGYASTSTWSPVLKKYIALAHLQRPYHEPGTAVNMEVTVEHQRRQAPARVVKLPFYEPEWKKK
ncbi:MAG: aminomethyl transferase family protein [Gammaproteobacteria bacterium]|jgi:aminomethyltransferase|nr:aminomethyl transferase family protein [Gammaproteobacteria bacterium]MBP6052616.1 aminomethyltransferase family protein [Pseudomonadales bacterium]MBK6582122.1 aminomethyl transferase family protein [Gammaproteobacteria bacterium]MBK7171585.1 aminomethyl transferase family protein [Gammaproteobacteria bacterium]MBK7729378.1 aminomethyl transferase family protein [Gammaproteobacteria bacterium]